MKIIKKLYTCPFNVISTPLSIILFLFVLYYVFGVGTMIAQYIITEIANCLLYIFKLLLINILASIFISSM